MAKGGKIQILFPCLKLFGYENCERKISDSAFMQSLTVRYFKVFLYRYVSEKSLHFLLKMIKKRLTGKK